MKFLKDCEFIRGNCPMTKEDIRILSLARLNLGHNTRALDVGAGTGSIAINMAVNCVNGQIVAIERDEEAIDTIEKNLEKFQLNNFELVKGEALEVAESIEGKFGSIFIGGSGGNLEKIIEVYGNKLEEDGTMVLNFITINNVYKAMEKLKELNFKVDCTMVNVSKNKGNSYMMVANNPIFIVEATKK